VFDGRKRHHARAAAGVTAALTTLSLGLTMSPASAAPDNQDIDSAQARVDQLSQQAETAEQRHDKAATRLTDARTRLRKINVALHRQQRLMDSLRAKVADTVVDEYDGTAGTSAPTVPLDPQLAEDSEVMLTNVTVVTEDTGRRGDAMARSNARIGTLIERRATVRDRMPKLTRVERTLGRKHDKASSREADAAATLADLEAERMAALGGPAVAYAKAQVGKAYVYGAMGPDSFDCSGLTMAAWAEAGVSLPHSSSAQYSSGPHISESELQPGDLVFYYSPISHVGMYIGNGQIVNALNPGSGVQISGLHDMPYVGAVRPG
jgi:peptidoglycan DL-endopeptidase CwlO